MSNKKQTSVDWLYYQIVIRNSDVLKFRDYLKQAKEMFEQQIMDAHNQGYADGYRDNGNSPIDYYKETYE